MSKFNIKLADADNSLNNLNTTYAGEFAGKYITAALLSGKTLNEGSITIKPNVKYKEVIKKVDTTGLVADATCDFDLQADVLTLSERILEPSEYQVNLQLCKKDFRNDWEAVAMGISAYDNLPPAFSDFLISHVAAKVAEKMEQNIWQGVDANPGEFDGFTTLLAADGAVNAASSTGSSYTSSNIIGNFSDVVDAIPSAVYGKEDLTIYVPTAALQAYVRALGGFGASGLGAAGFEDKGSQWYDRGNALAFEGIKIQHAPGMPADHIVAGEASNLYFGTGLLADHNEVKLIDTGDILGDQNVRVIMRFTAGVQYGVSGDLVLQTLS